MDVATGSMIAVGSSYPFAGEHTVTNAKQGGRNTPEMDCSGHKHSPLAAALAVGACTTSTPRILPGECPATNPAPAAGLIRPET